MYVLRQSSGTKITMLRLHPDVPPATFRGTACGGANHRVIRAVLPITASHVARKSGAATKPPRTFFDVAVYEEMAGWTADRGAGA